MYKFKLIFGNNISRFIISGASASLVEYVIFVICTTRIPLETSNIISFTAGFFISFSLNKMWVFTATKNTARQMLLYFLLSIFNLIVGTFMIWFLVNNICVWQYAAKIIIMILIATWNFFIYKKIIFKSTHSQKDE